ncbi:MAG: cell wall hydrolase [Candidatus Daviesbacteria bacterium]|nr:cell wall hydrolase [Candidatus Daviesbacteria bacterium]
MDLVFEGIKKRIIKKEDVFFSLKTSGLYLIEIVAREIILKDNQYDGMWNKYTYQKVRDPLSDSSETREKEWQESYEVASDILSGKLSDPTHGATNFHSFQDPKDFPFWATKETFKIKLGDIYFYELEK